MAGGWADPAARGHPAVHGANTFVKEVDVVMLWPIIRSMRVAPINNESVLNFMGEHSARAAAQLCHRPAS